MIIGITTTRTEHDGVLFEAFCEAARSNGGRQASE